MESDNVDGPSIKAAFPYTRCCFHVVCESSDLDSPQILKENRISYHSRCGIVVLASLSSDSSSYSLQPHSTAPSFPVILVRTCTMPPSLFLAHMSSVWPLCTNLVEKSTQLCFGNEPFFVLLLHLPVAYRSSSKLLYTLVDAWAQNVTVPACMWLWRAIPLPEGMLHTCIAAAER